MQRSKRPAPPPTQAQCKGRSGLNTKSQSGIARPRGGACGILAIPRRLIGRASIRGRRRHAPQRVARLHECIVLILFARLDAAAALPWLPRRSRHLRRRHSRPLSAHGRLLHRRRRVSATCSAAAGRGGMPGMYHWQRCAAGVILTCAAVRGAGMGCLVLLPLRRLARHSRG